MKNLLFLSLFLCCFACQEVVTTNIGQIVNNKEALEKAIETAEPGTEIVLANGVWKDLEIDFETINKDLFGNARTAENNSVGAINQFTVNNYWRNCISSC